ncbi:MAG TPA: curli assembly protein CsgF [Caulobacteraceae bacterium]|jgi:curli production assembly/transport component CsgF
MRRCAFVAAALGLALTAGVQGANAQQLVYTPINPAFGGNPLNSSQLEADASAQNPFKQKAGGQGLTQAQLFAQQLQSELLAGLANDITQAIFGPNAKASGTTSFDGETISWVTTLGEVTITITDSTGGTSVITLPTTGG